MPFAHFLPNKWAHPSSATSSIAFLLFSNAVTMYFAIAGGWELPAVMLVYWVQSVTIGVLNFVRILRLKEFSVEGYRIGGQQAVANTQTKVHTAFFFLLHYGIFHAAYAALIFNGSFAFTGQMAFAALLFFLTHLFAFVSNPPVDTKTQNIGLLMFYPYIRIIPMHLMPSLASGSFGLLPLFLLLKTAADVAMHLVERLVIDRHARPR